MESKPHDVADEGYRTILGNESQDGIDVEALAFEQIYDAVRRAFPGLELVYVLAAMLHAQGYRTAAVEPATRDHADVLAYRDTGRNDIPHALIRVARGTPTVNLPEGRKLSITAYRAFTSAMREHYARQGILVAWRGFRQRVLLEARDAPHVQLRDGEEIVWAFLDQYESLPDTVQAEVPLKSIWVLDRESPNGQEE
jgi:restriction system protein